MKEEISLRKQVFQFCSDHPWDASTEEKKVYCERVYFAFNCNLYDGLVLEPDVLKKRQVRRDVINHYINNWIDESIKRAKFDDIFRSEEHTSELQSR